MSSEPRFDLYRQATLWADQLRNDPSFTIADAEELKGHLLDISEALISQGLSQEAAFGEAVIRLGGRSELKEEFEETNTPVIQLRKAILVLSGILIFFLFYFFVTSSARLLIMALNRFSENEALNGVIVKSYAGFYLLLIVISTAILYFTNLKWFRGFEERNIRPAHTFLLFFITFLLALGDFWLDVIINQTIDHGSYTYQYQLAVFDYFSYLVPLCSIAGFIFLYKKYIQIQAPDLLEVPTKSILLVLSGILVYFFLHFLLHSSARIYLSAMQFHVNDPDLNIRRTWSFAITFQLFFIFLTAALYFLDKNLIKRIKKMQFRLAHTIWLLFATIFLAILDRCFLPIVMKQIGHCSKELVHKYWDIFIVSDLSFPFVLGACFLVLFAKYYRECVNTGY